MKSQTPLIVIFYDQSQEAGRAGRRGLDKVGTVVIAAWNQLPEPQQIKTLLRGKATNLSSQFRLRYNMILNLIRMNNLSVEDMMKRSFTEFYTQRLVCICEKCFHYLEMYVSVYVCMFIYKCVCMCVFMYVYIYVCVCMCVKLSKQDFGTKLAEYNSLLDFLKVQQIQLDIQTHTDAPLSSFSQDATGSEIYSAEIDRLVDCFDDCQQVLEGLLDFVPKKRRTKDFYDRFFTAGRLVCVQTDKIGCPCLAMIMRSPFDSFLHQQTKSATVAAKSDSDLMREQLQSLQGNSKQQQEQELLQDMHLWLLIYMPPEPVDAPFHVNAFDGPAVDKSKPFRELSRRLDFASGQVVENAAQG